VLFACYNNNPISSHLASNSVSSNNNQNGDRPNSISAKFNEVVSINCVVFGEKALVIATNLYEENAGYEAVLDDFILKTIIQTLYVPLSLKYSCPNPSTWKLSIECLFKVLKKALPIAQKNKAAFETMWLDLGKAFEDFLFTKK
jgi:hypothetical protein